MNVELPMCLIDWIDTDDINWHRLTENNSQGAIQLFKKYPEKINWDWLSRNPSEGAMRLLEKNQDKINWSLLCKNPGIFTYDYKKMKQNCMLFKEDLMKNRFHLRNILKFKYWGVNGFESHTE